MSRVRLEVQHASGISGEIMNILGIDLSLNATGLAMLTVDATPPDFSQVDGRKRVLHQINPSQCYQGALIVPRSTDDTLGRWEDVLCPILAWAMEAHAVIIEGYAFAANMAYHNAIVEMGGILRYHLRKLEHVPIEIAPMSLKKFLTGHGNAQKPDMVAAVQRLGLPIEDHNMADAFGLAQLGHALTADVCNLPRYQREVIGAIKYPTAKFRKVHGRKLKFTDSIQTTIGGL